MPSETVMTTDTPQRQVIMSEKTSEQHVEDSKEYHTNESTSPVQSGTPPEWEEEKPRLNTQMVLAFIALTMQFNAYIFTLLIPSTTLSTINAELGPSPIYSWITVSWTLAASIIISVAGRLSDIFGRRKFMIFGACLSLVGCVVGATGRSVEQMIASGAILGTGSGFQEMSYACIQEIVPNRWRIYAIGLFDFMACISFLGPLVAFAFIGTTEIGWRGAYVYMTCFHAAALILLFFVYHPPTFETKHKDDGKTKMQLLAELDYVGLFLFSAACILFLLGVNYGGRQYPWRSAHVIAPMITGVLCFVALGFWEVYSNSKYPLMPPRLFKKWRRFTMVLVVCFVGGMLYYAMNVLWPRQSQLLFTGPNPITKGLYAEMIPLGTIIASFIVVVFCARVGHERWQLFGFMIVETALVGSLASVGVNDKVQAIVTIICLSASVTPPQLLSFTMLSLGIDDQTDIGIAVGLAGTFRLLGGSIATAIYTSIVNNKFAQSLPSTLVMELSDRNLEVAETTMQRLLSAATLNTAVAYRSVPGINADIIAAASMAVKEAYVQAFRLTYLAAIGFGGAAVVAAFFTMDIDKGMKNDSRAVRLENEEKVVRDEKFVV